jgi:hypothetical protein
LGDGSVSPVDASTLSQLLTSSGLADVPAVFRFHEPALRFTYAMPRRDGRVRIA